ncbi:DUF3168 domain-containing protein [Sphingomonas histidinilytica]|uniref:DUF3168 domain-containing protein n=1 Tax=Rhizorhabdus histidinilytica TaxID=439228 RepID=UPI001ADBBF99|nr:DUF3168 domain-containing protein [Rhizorhabdus histidinilytica]MBO9380451.1 DUF3168 domain-containing protein [Rhizorhabdus histidinilytica]
MTRSRDREIRRAMLAELRGSAPLVAIVPATSIFSQIVPANQLWPIVKMGAPSGVAPVRGTCMDGAESIVAVHGFTSGIRQGKKLIENGEDHAGRIGDAIATALDGKRLPLEGGGMVRIRWTGSQLLQDAQEAGGFHTVQNFQMRRLT